MNRRIEGKIIIVGQSPSADQTGVDVCPAWENTKSTFRQPGATVLRYILWLTMIFLAACATIETTSKPVVTKLTVSNRMTMPFQVKKCLREDRTGTLYILQQDSPYVFFYRDGKQIFSLGGFGNEKTNFVKLTDIAIDPDGNLLALDSFARLVRKYTSSGMWIADIELQGFLQPEKLCITPDGDLIIYDAAPKELKRMSGFDRSIAYSFGKFQINNAGNIFCNKDYVLVTDEAGSSTQQYTLMGQFVKTYPYQLGMDNYLYSYFYENGAVTLSDFDLKLPLGWQSTDVTLMIDKSSLYIVHRDEIVQIERTFGDR